jgi:CBS domain-containing membrane protein
LNNPSIMSSNRVAATIPWMRTFWPAPLAVDRVQRLRMAAGALIGVALTAWLCRRLGAPAGLSWIIAPMGASAVLVFCLPASPLAQPWPVVGGNIVSALIGIACAQLISAPDTRDPRQTVRSATRPAIR